MKKRKLNSDQLGKKGESRFPELCIDAGLVPNGATWDRRGWDFVVDWPHADNVLAYDNRPAPLSCLVQLKTIWTSSASIQLRLSSVEHIAKDVRPTFIYVLRVADDLSFTDARIIHLEGDFLAFVLKELRKARLAGKAPNSVDIRVPLKRWATVLVPDGESLRLAIENAVGPILNTYTEKKQRQLRDLGYENGGHLFTTTIKGDDVDHVVDAFLGLRKINVVNSSAVERRFDIDIPIPALNGTSGLIEIKPQPHDTCTMLIRTSPGTAPFRFKGAIYGVPKPILPKNQLRFLIRNELFDLLMRADVPDTGRASLSFTIRTDGEKIGKVCAKAADWAAFYGFMAACGDRPLLMEIQAKKVSQPLVGTISADNNDLQERLRRPALLASIAADILERAGWPGTKLKIEDIGGAGDALEILEAMIKNPADVTTLSFTTEKISNAPDAFDMLFIDRFSLGDHCIAYAVKVQLTAQLSEDAIVWVGSVPEFRDVARIKKSNQAYENYIDLVRKRTGIQSYLVMHTIDLEPSEQGSSNRLSIELN